MNDSEEMVLLDLASDEPTLDLAACAYEVDRLARLGYLRRLYPLERPRLTAAGRLYCSQFLDRPDPSTDGRFVREVAGAILGTGFVTKADAFDRARNLASSIYGGEHVEIVVGFQVTARLHLRASHHRRVVAAATKVWE